MFGRSKHDDAARSYDDPARGEDTRVIERPGQDPARAGLDDPEQLRRDRFGGVNWGAGFFGWLVAVAVTVLLTGLVGAVTAGTDAEEQLVPSATTTELGLLAVIVLAAVLVVGYYAGGYVAGRMSRFDGPRQGLAVWVIGLVVTALAVGAGAFFGDQYDVLARVDLPTVPLSTDTMTTGGLVLAGVLLLGTLVAAMAGGGVGRHYHARVDKAGW